MPTWIEYYHSFSKINRFVVCFFTRRVRSLLLLSEVFLYCCHLILGVCARTPIDMQNNSKLSLIVFFWCLWVLDVEDGESAAFCESLIENRWIIIARRVELIYYFWEQIRMMMMIEWSCDDNECGHMVQFDFDLCGGWHWAATQKGRDTGGDVGRWGAACSASASECICMHLRIINACGVCGHWA